LCPLLLSKITKKPDHVYKDNGWVGWGGWLGTGILANKDRTFSPFEEAREFVHGLKLSSETEWRSYSKGLLPNKPKKPEDIPSTPSKTYKDKGWIGFGDWLGTGTIRTRDRTYRSFIEAREFVRGLKLSGQKEWGLYYKGLIPDKPKKPDDIPTTPSKTYENKGWVNLGDWLGTGRISDNLKKYRPFKQARKFVRDLGISSSGEWRLYCKGLVSNKPPKPDDIPAVVHRTYKDNGWVGWGDWLGTGTVAPRDRIYRPFLQARKFVRKVKLSGEAEWRLYCKGLVSNKPPKPDDIPYTPSNTYKGKGWKSWGDWLGTGRIADHLKKFRSFKDARKFAQSLKLRSQTEWNKYCKGELNGKPKKPSNIPSSPNQAYKGEGWISMPDWLGTENKKK
jgi:hypothetical protein